MTYNLIENKEKVLLCHSDTKICKIFYYMTSITDEQIIKLNSFTREDTIFINNHFVRANNIVAYGDIDINKDADKDFIKGLNLVNEEGFIYPTSFDYETGNISSVNYYGEERFLIIDTIDPIKNFKFKHCKINKANKIIIYKDIFQKIAGKLKYTC